jgi:hypothetical protein
MRIVEELSSFYRHIYLDLPGFTRLVGVVGAGAPLRFGVFPANLYKKGEPTSGLEPLTSSPVTSLFTRFLVRPDPSGNPLVRAAIQWIGDIGSSVTYQCVSTGLRYHCSKPCTSATVPR